MSSLPSATPLASNLTVPASQNTAPVIKFRCLYTYDLRRKAKRWQDGFLRFHTFNKRVMVYDTPGNFIGDLHWRQDNEIQDGDELELDKGVLIEVCEPMEKTETDLSKLFEKKKTVQGSPRTTQPLAQSPRPSTPLQSSTASQTPNPRRSLNDLLGIKRTPIERLVSPYEARHTPAQQEHNSPERAPKRQRVLPVEERRQENRAQASNHSHPVVIDLVESTPPAPAPIRQPSVSLRRPRTDTEPKRPRVQTESNTPAKAQPSRAEKPPQGSAKDTTPSTSHAPHNPAAKAPVNTLRLSSEKPRRKLMYQALLPTQGSGKSSDTTRSENRSNPHGPTENRSQKIETRPPNHLLTGSEFAPSASTQFALDEIIDVDAISDVSTSNHRHSTMSLPALNHSTSPGAMLPGRSPQMGLRKSLSDPSALTSAVGIQARQVPGRSSLGTILDEDGVHDQGPWTSEALDLFDFWPPGRPKPG